MLYVMLSMGKFMGLTSLPAKTVRLGNARIGSKWRESKEREWGSLPGGATKSISLIDDTSGGYDGGHPLTEQVVAKRDEVGTLSVTPFSFS